MTTGRITAAMTIVALAGSTAFSSTVFFGRDLNTAPIATRGSTPIPAGQRINSTNARNGFFGGLPASASTEVESFEDPPFSEGDTPASNAAFSNIQFFFGDGDPSNNVVASIAGGATVDDGTGTPAGQGRYATDLPVNLNNQFLQVDSGNTMTLSFDTGVRAFGFWGTDINDVQNELGLEIMVTMGSGESFTIAPSDGPVDPGTPDPDGGLDNLEGNLIFWGIITDSDSDLISSIVFSNIAEPGDPDTDIFGFDQFIVSRVAEPPNVVPIPTPIGLTAAGLGLVLAVRRRR